jgi:hypothetical protein
MGASGSKEPARNITFENQILVTEAALQQLQSSVGKRVPQAANTHSSDNEPLKPINTTNNVPLPTIDSSGTVETWRALASSVNDRELQRLREEYKQKLNEQDRNNRETLNLTKENLAAEVEKVESKFSKYIYSPICELERADIEQCYLANPKQVLTCSIFADKFIKCVQHHREQCLRIPQQQQSTMTSDHKATVDQQTFVNPSSNSSTSTTANTD